MKSTHSLIAISIAIALSLTDARKTLANVDTNKHGLANTSPKVDTAGVCSNGKWCFFDDGINSWCLAADIPIATVGWELDQTYLTSGYTGIEYWSLRYRPYVTTNLQMDNEIKFGINFDNVISLALS
jgi:hypothetical protein